MLPGPRTLALVLSLAFATSGCATTWGVLKVTGTEPDFYNDGVESVTAVGPLERQVQVTVVPEPAPPPQAPSSATVEPPAAPAWAPGPPALAPPPPPPPPGPPPPRVRFQCLDRTRHSTEHVRRETVTYNGKWKLMTAFMFVAESALSAIGVGTSLQKSSDTGAPVDAFGLGVGIFLGLDALATAALFFHPLAHHLEELDRPGPWAERAECPAGLVLEQAGQPSPIAADGSIDADASSRVVASLLSANGRLALRAGPYAADLAPSPTERCVWARTVRLRTAFACPSVWIEPHPPGVQATLKLPPLEP